LQIIEGDSKITFMPAKKTSTSATPKTSLISKKEVKAPAKASAKGATKPAPTTAAKSVLKTETTVKNPVKTSVKKTPLKTTATSEPKPNATRSQSPVIAREEIELRAYFISERRHTMGWPGNSSTDWAEAEAQLLAEASRRLKQAL
jgi:hypothetical protein